MNMSVSFSVFDATGKEAASVLNAKRVERLDWRQ